MKITHFFIFLFLFSLSLFVFLKPESYMQSSTMNVPQLEISDFTLYELDTSGVKSIVNGTTGRQYTAHYEVQNVHYIENENKLGEHLYADNGIFKGDIAYLNDNVRYFREDGLSFESDYAVYNTNKEHLFVPSKFVLTQNENVIYGKDLNYYSVTGKINAKNINANYYIEDEK